MQAVCQMAQAIGAGITAAGKSADVVPMETISPADLKDQAVWVLGCPAMGATFFPDANPSSSDTNGSTVPSSSSSAPIAGLPSTQTA